MEAIQVPSDCTKRNQGQGEVLICNCPFWLILSMLLAFPGHGHNGAQELQLPAGYRLSLGSAKVAKILPKHHRLRKQHDLAYPVLCLKE